MNSSLTDINNDGSKELPIEINQITNIYNESKELVCVVEVLWSLKVVT